MLISLCVPYFNREDDLAITLPYTQDVANASPPAEICLLNYKEHRNYWYTSHAYNMVIKKSMGDYFVLMGADAILSPAYLVVVRQYIRNGHTFMRCRNYKGIMCCQKKAFLDVGGYDERFEFYGPEDQELEERLIRNGHIPAILPDMIRLIRTPEEKKVANFRLKMTKREMAVMMHKILDENRANKLMVANVGKEWGV